MTGLTFYFNDNLVPTSNKLAESTLRSGIGSSFTKGKSKNNIIFSRKGSRIDSSTLGLLLKCSISLLLFLLSC